MNWRGRPLTFYRTIIELISATTTTTGPTIRAEADTNHNETRVEVSNKAIVAIPLGRHDFHGDWNDTIAQPNSR